MERGTNSTSTHSGGAPGRGGGDKRGGDKRQYRDPTGDKPNQQSDGKAGGSHGNGSDKSDENAAGKKSGVTASIVEKNGITSIASEKRQTIETWFG
ncbi:uncharacterized protein EAE98_003744 [Botrytis deweyae]|uniref:Uncharacterized protein n=2 Tax=Botrytis TaxID=33196 RepID=A0A4Z1K3H6_9HELO|nr:uncharacterized protein EAE98_003744 [Botrytis deweyae]KAF7918908.1 hypothetical protein EAE99_008633 [Botrytis elliptica]KAF7932445.1 hypothetical protein EAE98_003744 [Botrytis deweyae]TGO78022.1 hypothetical protein BELL_0082g00170 [Botrytis elliptica]